MESTIKLEMELELDIKVQAGLEYDFMGGRISEPTSITCNSVDVFIGSTEITHELDLETISHLAAVAAETFAEDGLYEEECDCKSEEEL